MTVDNHIQLNGAVIGSTATADKNKLDTGTIGFSDIHNQADFSTEHQGMGLSTGGSIGSNFLGNLANTVLAGMNNTGHDEGTTKAAVSDGTIIVRDQANQQQDVGDLSRDVANANGSIGTIFDKEKEQSRLQQAQLIGEIGSQATNIAMTEGELTAKSAGKAELAEKGIKEPGRDAPQEEKDKYNAQLANTAAYKDTMKQFGTGSPLQQGITAITAALQGLAGGDMAKALMGASAPYLAEVIHNQTIDPATGKVNVEANLVAHAVLGAVTASVNGNNALAGASGAVMGEYIAQQMYPNIKREDLKEEQRKTISALGTIAAALAGGLVGDSSADAMSGALIGKNAVENNNLSAGDFGAGMADYGLSVQSYAQYAQDKNLPPEQVQADLARMVKGDLREGDDVVRAILMNAPVSDTVMAILTAKEAKDYALALLTSLPADKALSLVGKASKIIDNKILISAAEKISTAKPGKQFTAPRDLNEQILWNQVKDNPAAGQKLIGMNNDPRFPSSAGFQKMQITQKNSEGKSITIHYQYNSITGKAYDVKIDTPQRVGANPSDVLNDIKGRVK